MSSPNYWLDLFTGASWQEFLDAGGDTSGFPKRRWNTVKRLKQGDFLLAYVTGISRFIAVLEVTSDAYQDDKPIWNDAVFPCRVKVKIINSLTPETAVPIHNLRDNLSIFKGLENPNTWGAKMRSTLARWKQADGNIVVNAISDAVVNPVVRPVNPQKLARRPRGLETKIGPVTVPDAENVNSESVATTIDETSEHTTIQYQLLKLGNDMGFSIWVARNDISRRYNGKPLSTILPLLGTLPLQFDDATTKTIELIDVLWLQGNAIVAAFEIESTTSIYSGLLRMSDLLAMQPNINIPLYLVAPEERRDKVLTEVNRPTFSRLNPPLSDVCRYISFSYFQKELGQIAGYARYLKPDYLEELSESCQIDV